MTDASPPEPPPEWLDGPWPRDADREVAQLYGAVTQRLRVPYLSPFWRALFWNPETASSLWAAVEPVMATRAFEDAAMRVRRMSLIDGAAEMPTHQAFKADLVRAEVDWEMRDRIANFNAAVQYGLAKTLLAATWLNECGVRGAECGDSSRVQTPAVALRTLHSALVPTGLAPGAVPVSPVPPTETRGRLAELLPEIRATHGHAVDDDYFRSLGRLPEYLNAAWNAILPVVRDQPYDEHAARIRAEGRAQARAFSTAALPDLSPEGMERLRAVCAYYAERHLPDLLMDASMIKGITDGPERALANGYEV